MNVLDLFSGVGGFSLGLERAGMKTVAFCEIDKKAQAVLKKHWPDVPIFEDVSTLSAKDLNEPIDVICGGFPCQDISVAGKGAGLSGARSGLWWQYHRLIQEIRPKWVIAENVSALRSRGLETVLRSLAEVGYDAEWHCIPASAVGAPQGRDRVWILAYPNSNGCGGNSRGLPSEEGPTLQKSDLERFVASLETPWPPRPSEVSSIPRGTDGVPGRSHRNKQLGNAVVPQIPELIGRAILAR